jgi:hypothetical protein
LCELLVRRVRRSVLTVACPPGAHFGRCPRSRNGRRPPVLLGSAFRWTYEAAACGKRIKVVLSVPFDDADPDACPKCVTEAIRRSDAGTVAWWAEHQQRQHERTDRWLAREEERQDIRE